MTLQEPVAAPDALANPIVTQPRTPIKARGGFFTYIRKTLTITEWEVRKLRHDPSDILTRTVQPVLWLLVFGETFSSIHAIPTGGQSYLQFLAPGILAQSILFLAIFSGIAVVWERDLGIIHKYLASPMPRSALVLGKGLAAGMRGLPQAIIIYALSVILGVQIRWDPLDLLGVFAMVILGAALFSTFSLIIACLMKTRDRVMGIGQVLTMPLFFASNAIYSIDNMPAVLQVIAKGNPLSYEVDALRTMMVTGFASKFGLGLDFAVVLGVTTLFIIIGARLYPNIVQ